MLFSLESFIYIMVKVLLSVSPHLHPPLISDYIYSYRKREVDV